MTRPAALKLLFNAVGILIGLVLVGYILYSGFARETKASCRSSYPSTTRLSMRNAQGKLLSPIELQARAGFNEWGTLNNAEVVPQGTDGEALKVKLATLTDIAGGEERTTNGIHFNWKFAPLGDATSACLSYAVWLPKDFAFAAGGVLPGFIGGTASATTRFATRVRWETNGKVVLDAALPGAGFRPTSLARAPLTRGQWTYIDQEVVLNTPGKADGVVRMWVDGEEAGERTKLVLRKEAAARFLGVRVDVGYLRNPAKTGELRISPFQFSWR